MTIDLLRRMQNRQGINETEQLDLDRFISHGPVHQLLIPPAGAQGERAGMAHASEDFAPVGVRDGFQVGIVNIRCHPSFCTLSVEERLPGMCGGKLPTCSPVWQVGNLPPQSPLIALYLPDSLHYDFAR